MCEHFAGRLPSEIEAEPLLPMLQTMELQQMRRAWLAFRHKPADVPLDDLQRSVPGVETAIKLYSRTMRELKRRIALKRAAQIERSG